MLSTKQKPILRNRQRRDSGGTAGVPVIDPDSLLIFDENRKPSSKIMIFSMLGGGIILLIISIGVLLFGRISDEYI